MIRLFALTASLVSLSPAVSAQSGAAVATANKAALREPSTEGFVHAVQVYPFSDGAIYRLYTAPERVSDIALQAGETLTAVAAGDTVRWTVGDTTSGSGERKRTHILVKPFSGGLSTNLVITTDRRVYRLLLTSRAGAAMTAISWTYPADELLALARQREAAEASRPVSAGVAVERLDFRYAISGDKPAWRPIRAFDDGRRSWIEFPRSIAAGEAPPLFILGENGEAELVNYRMSGNFYVVDRLFGAAELRLGGKEQKIVRIRRIGGRASGEELSK